MADKSVHREKVEFKNTVKLEKAVTVTGKGLTQIVFSAETTIPVTADNNTDITVATIPANATIVDLGLVVGSQLATAGSSKCKVSFVSSNGGRNIVTKIYIKEDATFTLNEDTFRLTPRQLDTLLGWLDDRRMVNVLKNSAKENNQSDNLFN